MANLQNYKRVKIRMADMISQIYGGSKNLRYVYNTYTFKTHVFFADTAKDIFN